VVWVQVGDDQFGRDAIQNFRDNNVNVSLIVSCHDNTSCWQVDHVTVTREAHSGVAPITVNDRGNLFSKSPSECYLVQRGCRGELYCDSQWS
jgi:hypothetical protein